jgi:hypothetical protein
VGHEAAVTEGPQQFVETPQNLRVVAEHHHFLFREVGLLGDPAGEAQPRGLTRVRAHVEIDAGCRHLKSARCRDCN